MYYENKTISLIFGDGNESHVGMEKLGKISENGFTVLDLKKTKGIFKSLGCKCKLYKLHKLLLEENIDMDIPKAYILPIKNAASVLIGNFTLEELFNENLNLEYDKKALMYGRVVNKNCRHCLCFGDNKEEPEYEKGKGIIESYENIPIVKLIKENLEKYVVNSGELVGGSNFYYDIKKTGISYHGDGERKKVIILRLGENLPLHLNWFFKSEKIGKHFELNLKNGDMYLLCDKAIGNDWKKKNILTLRHATGCDKYIK